MRRLNVYRVYDNVIENIAGAKVWNQKRPVLNKALGLLRNLDSNQEPTG
jgi:hypothetical protein